MTFVLFAIFVANPIGFQSGPFKAQPAHAGFFDDDLDVVVTEKDAVKCTAFAHERLWYLPVDVVFEKAADMQWLGALHDKLQSSVSQEPA